MKRSHWAVALGTVLCAVALAACGGGGGDGGAQQAAGEEAGLEFASCMRNHGVQMPDPEPGEMGIEVSDPNDPATKKALAACNSKLDDASQETTPEADEEFREGWLAFSKCMREEGIPMGDPQFLGPGKMHLDIEGIDTESPAFEAAKEACGDQAPEMTGPGVGG